MISQQALINRVKSYDPDADEDLLNRAYVFGLQAHGDQKRASGEDYFNHPIEVAMMLADWNVDSATIATALLHDVLEDTHITAGQLKTLFGAEIAFLVEGVTKLSKLKEVSVVKAQAENFRKFVLAVSRDIRVLLIKLADRLHNMRTLSYITSSQSRERIAQETMEIYVPLAERTGMHEVATELADLSFKYLEPETYDVLHDRLEKLKRDSVDIVKTIVDRLSSVMRENGLSVVISGRQKTVYSIWKKMEQKNLSFDQLTDLMAFRVIVHTMGECYQALGIIHSSFPVIPGKFKDYISTPKPNGYASLHTTVIGPDNHKVEIQIRTQEMNRLAELGFAAHWKYKQWASDSTSENDKDVYYPWIKGILGILEATTDPEEFLKQTKLEMYTNQVFCFTPKGEVIVLPQGATCIDFAYAVHSALGDECVKVLVNGKKKPLWTVLETGDEVKVTTQEGHIPPLYWEEFAKTAKARMSIRKYASENALKRGEFIFEEKVRENNFRRKESLERAKDLYGLSTEKSFFEALGKGKINQEEWVEKIRDHKGVTDKIISFPLIQEASLDEIQRLSVEPKVRKTGGAREAFFKERKLVQCLECLPEPMVPVSGVLKAPFVIEIHKVTCSQINQAVSFKKAAFPVEWTELLEPKPNAFQVLVHITLIEDKAELENLMSLITQERLFLRNLKEIYRKEGQITYALVLEVRSIKEINLFLTKSKRRKLSKSGEWKSYHSGQVL